MASSTERYEQDIARLVKSGESLELSLQIELRPHIKDKLTAEDQKKLPKLRSEYQPWYSEALTVLMQLLPERVEDFKAYYAPKGARKELNSGNYTISDYLRGIEVTRGSAKIVGHDAACLPLAQQVSIIKSLKRRFSSSLFDIKTLVHADLLDDELAAAGELNKKGFQRGAGAVAGVVLEAHLSQVCDRHSVTPKKKNAAISDYNDALKENRTIEVSIWRFIQHLGDLRNKCDHKKETDPTKEEIENLIDGVRKITKTVF